MDGQRRLTKKIAIFWGLGAGLLVLGQVFLYHDIASFPKKMFSERVYVPAALSLLHFKSPHNFEHPPFGKEMIAAGIALEGDRPEGWRLMSSVFGTLTLLGVGIASWLLFQDMATCLWTVVLTAFDQLLYVEARCAFLDVFLAAGLIWAFVGWVGAIKKNLPLKTRRFWLVLSGLSFGVATASKWSGIVTLGLCWGLILLSRLLKRRRLPIFNDILGLESFSLLELFLSLAILPMAIYFLTFFYYFLIPDLHISWSDLLSIQAKMFQFQWHYDYKPYYASRWFDWVLLRKIIIYGVDKSPSEIATVALIGNPLVMWGGLPALGFCAYSSWKRRRLEPFLIIFYYFAFLAPWIFLSRNSATYYYYYPAGLMLSFALGYVRLEMGRKFPMRGWLKKSPEVFLAFAIILFFHFWPVLSGAPLSYGEFERRMWFDSWHQRNPLANTRTEPSHHKIPGLYSLDDPESKVDEGEPKDESSVKNGPIDGPPVNQRPKR